MTHGNRSIRQQRDLLLESLLVLGQRRLFLVILLTLILGVLGIILGVGVPVVSLRVIPLWILIEPFVGLLQERDMIIQFLQAKRSVQVELTVIGDIVTQ